MREPFQSDVPSTTDELKRRPFAERIAGTLVSPDVKSSLVLGIHAPAGDGKTTVLQFIREALSKETKTICLEFNPWPIENPAELPRSLLATLSDALEERMTVEAPYIHSVFQNYEKFFGGPAVKTPTRAEPGTPNTPWEAAGDVADASAESRSMVQRAAAKATIDRVLEDSGQRIVVLMDDVDRLDAPRLQAVFKLVKMTADFPSVIYVLAGDDAVISDRLSVALGRVDAGHEMVERTIQVSLNIPKADPELLRNYFLLRLKASLDPSAISVRPDAEARFSEMFLQGLQARIKTPRTAKRFINALGFALEMLKSRVNTVDLIVVEGIRLLYPNLYRSMRENRDDFLWYRISRDGPDADNRANELLHQATAGLKGAEQEAVQFLVRSLFPAFDRSRYPSRGDIERWGDDKRICSPEHFDRFFDYGNG